MMRRLETFRVKLMLKRVTRRKRQKRTRRMMERMKTMLRSRRRLVGRMKRRRRTLTWINDNGFFYEIKLAKVFKE